MGKILSDIIFTQCQTLLCLLALQSNGTPGFLWFWMPLNAHIHESAGSKGGRDLMEERDTWPHPGQWRHQCWAFPPGQEMHHGLTVWAHFPYPPSGNNPICSVRFVCWFMIILQGPACHTARQVVSFVLSTEPQAGKIMPYLRVHKGSHGPMALATPNYRLPPSSDGNSSRKTTCSPLTTMEWRTSGQTPLVYSNPKDPSGGLLCRHSDGD